MATNQNRIRGKEARFQLYFDGNRLFGNFMTLTDFEVSQDGEITSQQFIGEKRGFNDVNIRGYNWNITTQISSHLWGTLLDRLDRQEKQGRENIDVRVIIQTQYREVAFRQLRLEGQGVMRFTTVSASEDSYVTVAFEGRTQQMRTT